MTERQRGWLLPPLALCASLGVLAGRQSELSPLIWIGVLLSVGALLAGRGWLRFSACLVLGCCLGVAAGSAAFHPCLPDEGVCNVTGVISEDLSHGAYGHVRTVLRNVSLDGHPISGGAWWTFYTDEPAEDLAPGRYVSLRASVYHPSGADNPDGYDFREELLRRRIRIGIYGNEELTVSDPPFFSLWGTAAVIRSELSRRLIHLMGEEAGSYASALLLGNRTLIPSEDREAFSRLGIAHILSVSGFHAGILVGLLALLFRFLCVPQRLRLVLYSVVLLAYSLVCGMNQPVLRASVLTLLALEGRILNRPRISLHLLSACFLILLFLSPVQLTGASFLLSFGAMLGIALLYPALGRLCMPEHSWVRRIWNLFRVSLSAQIGVLLPELAFYQSFPLFSLIVNPLIGTAFSALLMLMWLVLLLLPVPPLAQLAALPVSRLTVAAVHTVRVLGRLEGASVWTPAPNGWTCAGIVLFFLSACTLFRWKRRIRLPLLFLSCLIVVLSLIPAPHRGTEYIQFSVGNADAALLLDEDQTVVLDTGSEDGILSGYLRRHRLIPDTVILTHLHADHAGGLFSLVADGIPIRKICLPWGAMEASVSQDILNLLDTLRSQGTEVVSLSRGDRIQLPSGSLTVLWPESERVRPKQEANSSSLVSLLTLHGVSLLQTGDLDGLYEMYAACPAHLLKMAHHGSLSSTSADFLSAVHPEAVILSCGQTSRVQETASRIGDTPLFATATGGALTVQFLDGRFRIIPTLPGSKETTSHD